MRDYKEVNRIPELPEELDFEPVKEQQTRNGCPIKGHYWIINPKTDNVIGAGKSKHTPRNFKYMWENFRQGIDKSGVDTSQLQVKIEIMRNNAAFRADIIFKNYDYKAIVGEPTQMKMRILDSHDQSLRRDATAMLMRVACTNGMVSISESLSIRQKHTALNNPEKIGVVVADFPKRLEREAELYQRLMTKPVSTDQARNFFTTDLATYFTPTGKKVNEKLVEEYMQIWVQYSNLDENAYRLYNVLTHLATHVEGREGSDIGKKRIRFEQQLEQIVHRPKFRELAGIESIL